MILGMSDWFSTQVWAEIELTAICCAPVVLVVGAAFYIAYRSRHV